MGSKLSAKLVSLFLVLSFCMLGYVSMNTSLTARTDTTGTSGMVTIDHQTIIRQGNGVNYSFASDATISKLELSQASIKLDGWLTIGAVASSGQLTNSLVAYTSSLVQWTSTCAVPSASAAFTISGLNPISYYKILADGAPFQTSPGPSVSFTYPGPWTSHTFSISPTAAPTSVPIQASFSFTLDGANLRCTDLSYGPVVTRVWQFGDGSGSSSMSPSHRYWEAGTFTITLTVYDAAGHSSVAQKSITIPPSAIPITIGPGKVGIGWGGGVLSLSAAGLIVGGVLLMILGAVRIDIPFMSPKFRLVCGFCMFVIGAYLSFN